VLICLYYARAVRVIWPCACLKHATPDAASVRSEPQPEVVLSTAGAVTAFDG
jgi:hypothetical protein